MTDTQLKRILKQSDVIWLMQDGLFNAKTFIHKTHLPEYFMTDKEENYRMLGYTGPINKKAPDMLPIYNKIDNYTVEYKATYWVFEDVSKRKKMFFRRYDNEESGGYLVIPNIYYETLNLKTLLADESASNLNPVCNQDKTIITMPTII